MSRSAADRSSNVSDEELVRRFQAGDAREAAFRELLERYVAITHAFFRRRIGHAETAADLNQDLHMTVYDNLDGFRGESTFRTWLFRLAHNRLSRLRRRWRVHLDERPDEVDDRFWSDVAGESADPADELEARRRLQALRRCLAGLGEVERLVVVGQYFHGRTLENLTAELKLDNPSGARAPLIAAQRKLRRCLERSGVHDGGAT